MPILFYVKRSLLGLEDLSWYGLKGID